MQALVIARAIEGTVLEKVAPLIKPEAKPVMSEQFAMKDINQAVRHVRDGEARYRAVVAA